MAQEPQDPTTLDGLAQATGIPERTIRSYISRGLLPPPSGRGRAASYGPEHLERLQFIGQVRKALPYEVPFALIQRLLEQLPPDQIVRIARGEESVAAVPVLGGVDPQLLRRKREPTAWDVTDSLREPGSAAHRADRETQHALRSPAPELRQERSQDPLSIPETWTTLQVTPDLRISLRGPAPSNARRLAALAERLRAWLAEEGRS